MSGTNHHQELHSHLKPNGSRLLFPSSLTLLIISLINRQTLYRILILNQKLRIHGQTFMNNVVTRWEPSVQGSFEIAGMSEQQGRKQQMINAA